MIEAKLICHSGDDLLVVNAARVSFAKHADEFRDSDAKLIGYLAKHSHWTPFAHPQITLHVKAPVFVRTQCFKHKVGFVENEVSRRYVDDDSAFYTPDVWRGRAENAKQGSAGVVEWVDVEHEGETYNYFPQEFYADAVAHCAKAYAVLVKGGVAPEQARMVLPQAMMTEWYWTGSLAAYARFCRQRMGKDAQAETGVVASACAALIEPLFPVSWKALTQ